jgi:hypothetical protein
VCNMWWPCNWQTLWGSLMWWMQGLLQAVSPQEPSVHVQVSRNQICTYI